MWKKLVTVTLLLILLAACSQTPTTEGIQADTPPPAAQPTSPEAQPAPAEPTATEPTAAQAEAQPGSQPAAPFPGLPLPVERGTLFSASGACAVCHQKMTDADGADVSNDTLWRSTMLANAARDPYWRATVRSETNRAPQLTAVIEKKCATCHMPMAEVTQVNAGEEVSILDQGLADAAHPLHMLAIDGVSCTLCHQVEPDNLGQPESFSGGYLIDTQLPLGGRMAYGPFQTPPNLVAVMQGSSGFIPQQGLHIQESEMCGSCHDLITPYLDSAGEVAGEFAEQLIYSEWDNSAFAGQQSCQSCHMPLARGSIQLSITGGPARKPFLQHQFVGGNAYMLRLLQQNGEALQVSAAPEHFEASIARTTNLVATQTARLTLRQPRVENRVLLAGVYIENLAGHKFPAGFPSRRAWLHIRLTDPAGSVVFESGAVDESGAIAGNDNDADAATFEPHYTLLSSPDQVQIYEGIMTNTDGQVTTILLRGAQYFKDNRLLPYGFQSNPAIPALDPQGEAAQDEDFTGGSDILNLEIDVSQAQGPFTLEVTLLYQTIGYRWAQNLIAESGAEIELFGQMYAALPNLPLTVDTVEVTVP